MKTIEYVKWKGALVLLIFIVLNCHTIRAQKAWEQMASMDIARDYLRSCTVDSLIYVFGGEGLPVSTSFDSADVYNTRTNEWTNLESMPGVLSYPAVEALNDKIYVLGGWTNTVGNEVGLNSVYEYDPAQNSWTVKTNSPYSIGGWASCVVDDTIYLIGGNYNTATDATKAWTYNPESEEWNSLPDLLYNQPSGNSVEIVDNKIYYIGGSFQQSYYNPTGRSQVFDPVEKTWTELAVMPVPVSIHVTTVYNNKILVFGGTKSLTQGCNWSCSVGTNCIQEYDPVTDTWRLMNPMPFIRSSMTGEKVDNYMYLIGGNPNGRDMDQPLDEVWRFNLDSLQEWCESVQINNLVEKLEIGDTHIFTSTVIPSDFANKRILWSSSDTSVAKIAANGILTCSGYGTTRITAKLKYGGCSDSFILTVEGPAWQEMASMDIARGYMSSCIIDSLIYVFGGETTPVYTNLDSADVFNIKTNQWMDLEAMPGALVSPAVEEVNSKIYVVGGLTHTSASGIGLNSVYEYNPDGNVWSEKNNSPYSIGAWSSRVKDSTIYLFGGSNNEPSNANKAWTYKPESETWTSLPNMLYNQPYGNSVEIIDNKFYYVGGSVESGFYNPTGKSQVYDPYNRTYSELSVMPVPVVQHRTVVHNNKILVFGGSQSLYSGCNWSCSVGTNCIQEYDPVADTWILMKPMPFTRSAMTIEKMDNYAYLIGGYPNGRDLDQALDEIWRFNLDSLQEWCESVQINNLVDTLKIGDTHIFTSKVLPSDFANKRILWSSSDTSVAQIATNGILTCTGVGSTTITAKLKYGSCFESYDLVVDLPSGVKEMKEELVTIYPNPVDDLLTIHLKKPGYYAIEMHSVNGQELFHNTTDGPEYQLDLTACKRGLYFVIVRSDSTVWTEKVIKL